MKISKVALIGAGAVGAYFIYGFDGLSETDFCVVAEGDRAAALKKDGIIINGRTYRPAIKAPAEAKGAELVLVCTKFGALDAVCTMLKDIISPDTIVMSLLNGIGSEEIIGEAIGQEHMLHSVTRIVSARRNGQITFDPNITMGIAIGEKGIKEASSRVKAVSELFERAGLHYSIEEDIVFDMWSKFAMNTINNLPQAVFSVGFGAFKDSDNMREIRNRMFDEVCAVAAKEGITGLKIIDWGSQSNRGARFSTLQDLDAGRHTEVDAFAGEVIRLGKKHGIPTPFNEFCYYAIKVLEEKNDGKFDY